LIVIFGIVIEWVKQNGIIPVVGILFIRLKPFWFLWFYWSFNIFAKGKSKVVCIITWCWSASFYFRLVFSAFWNVFRWWLKFRTFWARTHLMLFHAPENLNRISTAALLFFNYWCPFAILNFMIFRSMIVLRLIMCGFRQIHFIWYSIRSQTVTILITQTTRFSKHLVS